MFNSFKEKTRSNSTTQEFTLTRRRALKDLEDLIPDLKDKVLSVPEEAITASLQALSRLLDLEKRIGPLGLKEQEKRDVLEISFLSIQAEALTKIGNWGSGARVFEKCLALSEKLELFDFQIISLINLGKALRLEGKFDPAAGKFDSAILLARQHKFPAHQAEALYQKGVVAELQNQPLEAQFTYEKGLSLSQAEKLNDLTIRFLSQLGKLQHFLGELKAALDYYTKCLDLIKETGYPKESQTIVLSQISQIYAYLNDFSQGSRTALDGIKLSKETKQINLLLGFTNDLTRLYYGVGSNREARQFAKETLELATQAKDIQAQKEAEELLTLIGPIKPGEEISEVLGSPTSLENIRIPEIHYQQGNDCFEMGDNSRAIDCYTRAIELDPAFTSAFINRGSVFTAMGNYFRALEDYDQAIELDPLDSVTFYNRGNVHRKLRDYQSALADYSESIHLGPGDPDPFFNRGEVHRRLKQTREAAEDFEKFIELSGGGDEGGINQARRLLADLKKQLDHF